ncbi:MAG TPA: hypothetical protein VOA41_20815 [Candidatus Dormibacteraeota bacterium]|nr:hypothetical protein [Candidatus Dormibacteraeota bacterium]
MGPGRIARGAGPQKLKVCAERGVTMGGWIDSAAKTCAGSALRALVRLWPTESLEWGQAIATELESVDNGPAAVRWALGGVVVFAKALWKSFWNSLRRPLGVSRENTFRGAFGEAARGPRMPRWLTALLLAGTVVLLLRPDARMGAGEVLRSWSLVHRNPRNISGLAAIAKRAEQERDAATLAFAAMELGMESYCTGGICIPRYGAESVRLGEEAIALDPSFTWIYVNLLGWRADRPIPEQWVRRLEQWDPQNGVPHLLEAETIAREFRVQWKQAHPGMNFPFGRDGAKLLETQPAWLAAMGRAIEAPRFHSYMIRHSELNREVMRRKKIAKPTVAGFALAAHPLPQFYAVMRYVDVLLEQAGEAERAGDFNTAGDVYWRVAHFAEHLREQDQSSDIQTLIGADIQKRVYGNLETVLKKKGQFREAELVSYNLAEANRALKPQGHPKQPMWDAIVWSATLVHLCAVGIVLLATAAVLSMALLLSPARRWLSPWVRTTMCYVADFSPVLLLVCCGAFALSYHPFAQTFHRYLNDRHEITDLPPFMHSFIAPFFYGQTIIVALFGQHVFTVYFWWGVIAMGALVIAWMLIRMFRTRAADPAA